MRRAWRAFSYPFSGLRVYRDRRLRRLALAPVVFFALLLAASTVACVRLFGTVSDLVWPKPEGAWVVLWAPLQVFVAAGLGLAALVVVLVLQAIFTAPWNDALSERIERLRTGREGPPLTLRQVLADVGRTVRIELGKLALYVLVMGPLFLLSLFVPFLGPVVFGVVGFFITAVFLAFDYMDWPMSRRGWGLSDRMRFVRRSWGSAFAFGTGCWVILFVPLLNVLFVPAAVTGGTDLFLDLEADRTRP